MNYLALQARTTLLVSFGGWSNVSPAPSYTDLVDRAYRIVSWNTEFYYTTATVSSVASTATYTFTGTDIINLYDGWYGTTYAMAQSNPTQQRKQYSLWNYRTSSSPQYFWMQNPNVVRLHPTPSDTGTTVTFYCSRLPADMTADGDIPAFPAPYHEAIAYRAAALHGELYATGQEMERVLMYQQKAAEIEAQFMDWLASANKFHERQVYAVRPRRLM